MGRWVIRHDICTERENWGKKNSASAAIKLDHLLAATEWVAANMFTADLQFLI